MNANGKKKFIYKEHIFKMLYFIYENINNNNHMS